MFNLDDVPAQKNKEEDPIERIILDVDSPQIQYRPETSEKFNIIAYLSAIALAAIGFITGEGWLIALIALLGPIKAFLVASLISALVSNGMLIILNLSGAFSFLEKFRVWAGRKQKSFSPFTLRIVEISKVLGILVSSVAIGALLTTLLIDALGYKRPHNHILAILSSLLFCSVWVGIYSGAIFTIKRIVSFL